MPILSGKKILVTGGTGFVGRCLSDSFSEELIQSDVYFTSRRSAELSYGHHFRWDMEEQYPERRSNFDYIFHCATPASAALNATNPEKMTAIIVQGMERLLELINSQDSPPRVIFTSSGAVYGQNFDRSFKPTEDSELSHQNLTAYAAGKQVAEEMLLDADSKGICQGIITRLFAFSGVHLPLDRHFAIGNFVRDALCGNEISVRGTGESVRSYLDGKDLAHWLKKIAEDGLGGSVYHIGSERPISILNLAKLIQQRAKITLGKELKVNVLNQSTEIDGADFYVPDTRWTRMTLGLQETIALEDSIDSMIYTGHIRLNDK